jgi:hypothetical protein
MKKYRRVEITAFRHRVTISSGFQNAEIKQDPDDAVIKLHDDRWSEEIDIGSVDGQQILEDAVEILTRRLCE